jgi:PAS domain S-box-containing protein
MPPQLSMNTADSKPANFSERSPMPLWQRAALFGVAYFICAEAGSFLSVRGGTFLAFWLPAGLFLAVLLLNSTHDWPWLVLAVLPANLLFDHFYGTKFLMILAFYCANAIQAVTGAWLVRRFVAERPTLANLKEFFGVVGFAAIFSSMLGAAIGAGALVYFGLSRSFEQSLKILWGSNAMAVLVLTPFILTWFSKSNGTRNYFDSPKKITEAVLLFFGLSFFVWYVLTVDKGAMSPNKSLAIPFLLWAGLRFGVRGATAASLFISLALAFFTAQFFCGLTPSQISSGEYVFVMQAALAMASLVALIPAIIVGEREQTLAELRESEERFKNLAAAAFEGISISENGRILDANDQLVKMFGYERNELIGKEIVSLVAPETRSIVAESIRENRESIYGHQLLRKDGSSFYAEAQAKIVRVGNRTLRMTAVRDITERKLAEEALRESEAKRIKANHREQRARAKYTRQLIASQEAERTRIAAELHDGLGQNLLLIKNRAQLALGKESHAADLHEQMKGISDLASQTIAEVRQISHELHPPQLDHLGLTRALEAMIDGTAQASDIVFGHKLDFVDDIFSKDAAMNLYRIVQENLNNVLKHSRAKKAKIKLERDVHEVQLSISDDGCGFEPEESGDNPKGLGLKNIAERVKILGGKFKIDSQPGKGTRVEVTVPFSESE